MRRILIGTLSTLVLATGTVFLSAPPSMAQFSDVRQELKSLPTSRVVFPKGKTGTSIKGADNRIYILRARKGQTLTVKVNNLGARASVTLYGVNGKPVKSFGAFTDNNSIQLLLPRTGDYYIVGGSGPSNHLYDFTVSIK